MAEYLAPGVYVEETVSGSAPIEGLSTSTTGMIGVTERGPSNYPILITSYAEYTRWFGGTLNIVDFSNANGAHCYLPHAVQGYFSNGGQLLYVTRIIDTANAQYATTYLFDRGAPNTESTLLFRAAAEGTGTITSPPPLYLLDLSVIPTNQQAWFRIGDGSAADYLQRDDANTVSTQSYVPLNLPLGRSHDAGAKVGVLAYKAAGPSYTIQSQSPTARGQTTLVLVGSSSDITALVSAVQSSTALLEIGTQYEGEYRFALTAVKSVAGTSAVVTLDSGLALSDANGAPAILLDISAAPSSPDTLGVPAVAGDGLGFLTGSNGAYQEQAPPTPNLFIIDKGEPNNLQEVRRIGTLTDLNLTAGAYAAYPSGATLVKVTLGADTTLKSAAAANDTTVTLNNIRPLRPGMKVVLGDPSPWDEVMILSVTPDPNPANAPAGTIQFAPKLTNGYNVANPVSAGAALTSDVPAGATIIPLDARLGLSVGDLLRIDSETLAEYVTVAALPGAGGVPPDKGTIVLTNPLALPHANGTVLRRQNQTGSGPQAMALVSPVDQGAVKLLVTDPSGLNANDPIQVTTPQGDVFYHVLANAPTNAPVTFGMLNALNPVLRAHVLGEVVVPRNPLLTVQALDPGAWGNRLQVAVQDEAAGLVSGTTLATIISPTQIKLASAAGVESGTVLEFSDPTQGGAVVGDPVKVAGLNRTNLTITLAGTGLSAAQINAANNAKAAGQRLGVRSREFSLTVWWLRQPDPALPSRNTTVLDSEVFHNLSMDPRHSRYIQAIIGDSNGPPRLSDGRPEGQSWYIRVHDWAQDLPPATRQSILWSVRLGPEALVDILPTGQQQPARRTLGGGDDSIPTINDATYIGQDADDPTQRTGLFTLMNVEDISLIACPGRTSVDIQGALITQCESMRYRFAVLDGPSPPDDAIANVLAQRQQFDTKYAALYYPWLTIDDPCPRNLNNVASFAIPPSGHVLGIYARVDEAVGVHKAPANEVIGGIRGLQRTLYKPQQDILNPYPVNINVIRDFRHYDRGLVVYGARVITSDSDWIYVNVRRLLIFIEASLEQGLQWAVFEPNAEPLWARVRRAITNFLTIVWRNGALQGAKAEQAFYVKCDQTTMTQTDRDNGRLIAIAAVAPVKPAEFAICRISLWAAPPGP
jgi:phage tail sheath protein FI